MIDFTGIKFEPTDLCSIMNKHGSDKGNGWHNYTIIYNHIFKSKRNDNINLFEVGLGTNNLDVPSNMGPNGKPGASVYGWREYFPNANIIGADIDKRILFNSERIKTYYTNQLKADDIKAMWDEIDNDILFDIMIDDGLHECHANINFLVNSIHKLKPDGIYIIEDILRRDIKKYHDELSKLDLQYQIVDIPNKVNVADNILCFIKHK